jgi:hypothetical protein
MANGISPHGRAARACPPRFVVASPGKKKSSPEKKPTVA